MQLTFAVRPTTSACTIAGMNESLGQRIARLRKLKGLSQSALARALSVEPQAVQKWESGGVPRMQRMEAIAAVLEVSVAELMGSSDTDVLNVGAEWPFKGITPKQYASLDDVAKARIEGYIDAIIQTGGAGHIVKSKRTSGAA